MYTNAFVQLLKSTPSLFCPNYNIIEQFQIKIVAIPNVSNRKTHQYIESLPRGL